LSHYRSDVNGDCLYSSVSLALFGDNRFKDKLRAMSCIEMFTNAAFYGKHPHFHRLLGMKIISCVETALKISVSDKLTNLLTLALPPKNL